MKRRKAKFKNTSQRKFLKDFFQTNEQSDQIETKIEIIDVLQEVRDIASKGME